MQPDPSPIPGRNISLENAVRACATSAALATNQITIAEEYIRELKKHSSDFNLIEMIVGCLEVAKGNAANAIGIWNKILMSIENNSDASFIKKWINKLNQSKS